ncbi:2-oxoglutarate (2OG) and Fe(II)-dependent oxygenase superfamily protein isoform X2 [Wolffia australiana]
MGIRIEGKIERVNGKELSYDEFSEKYLMKNEPVLLTGLMDRWKACEEWVTEDRRPKLDFLSAHFGDSPITVADCTARELTDQKRTEMSLSEFMDYWRMLPSGSCNSNRSISRNNHPLLYLKDWHFVKEYPAYVAYKTASFFRDDWLNIYLDHYGMQQGSNVQCDQNDVKCSDYRFVYMGPEGTWTPLHADVFRSYSWSGNVCGKKHWFQRNTVYDIFDEVSEKQFPGFGQTIWRECIQEEGEIIFVPSGWFHQVHNMEDTISINHNWFNGHNLDFVWKLLLRDYCEAKEYIEDIRDICDDFEWLCQRNLAANTGMNFYDFFIFISRFTVAIWGLLYHLKLVESSEFSMSSNVVKRLIFNLVSVYNVAKSMEYVEAFNPENIHHFPGEGWHSLVGVRRIMGEDRFQEFAVAIIESIELPDEFKQRNIEFSIDSLISEGFSSSQLSQSVLQESNYPKHSRPSLSSPADLVRLIEHLFAAPDGVCYGLDPSFFPDISCNLFQEH